MKLPRPSHSSSNSRTVLLPPLGNDAQLYAKHHSVKRVRAEGGYSSKHCQSSSKDSPSLQVDLPPQGVAHKLGQSIVFSSKGTAARCPCEEIPHSCFQILVLVTSPSFTMSTSRESFFGFVFLLALLSIPFTAIAQATASTALSMSAISTSSPQATSNDPGGVDTPAPEDPNIAGASGETQTAITLNTGDQIAIGVVVGLVAFVGISSAILFYLAKKRQWEVRATLRRSARRVTTAFKAATPIKPNFSRRDRGVVRIDPPPLPTLSKSQNKSKRNGGILKEGKARPEAVNTRVNRDLEKGFDNGLGCRTRIEAIAPRSSPPIVLPKSSFEMDSPLTGNHAGARAGGKKGNWGWMKMFGSK